MGYGQPCGLYALRRAIAAHLKANRGISCEPAQVFVVGGAQEAFRILADILLDPGDNVWFENPGAVGARNASSPVAPGRGLPIDDEGMSVATGLRLGHGQARIRDPCPPAAARRYHEPRRRFALLEAADATDAYVVEDDYDGEFCYGGHAADAQERRPGRPRHLCRNVLEVAVSSIASWILVCPISLVAVMENLMGADYMAFHPIPRRSSASSWRKVILRPTCDACASSIPSDTRPCSKLRASGFPTGLRLCRPTRACIRLRNLRRVLVGAVAQCALVHDIMVTPIGRYCVFTHHHQGPRYWVW